MPQSRSTDVVVIGGGPAGSSTASFLRQRGLAVTVFERERFPREHVGESLLPFCHGLFRDLGVLAEMEKRYVRKPGVRFISSDGSDYTTWCFDRVIDDESYLSFQVVRSEFDELLLDNSARLGAEVHEETRVTEVDLERPDGGVSVQAVGPGGDAITCEARFLIDASGRETFIGSRMRWREANKDLQRTALWTHFEGANLIGGLEEGVSIIAYLGGDKKGWAWVFPLARGKVTVGLVADNEFFRGEKKRLGEADDWQQSCFEQEIMRSPFIRRVLEGSRQGMPLIVNGDYSYSVKTKYGANFALVGDAGRFIDPIFSSGVFLSIKSARLVGDAIADAWHAGRELQSGLPGVYEKIDGAYGFVARMIRLFYDPHALRWDKARPGLMDAHEEAAQRHSAAMAAGHYMLAGDFFEKHEKYNAMFDVLEQPREFNNYKKLVIDRVEYDERTCKREGTPSNFPV